MPLSDELKFCVLFSGQYLTEMHSIAPCKLCNLLSATEAIGNYDGIAWGPLSSIIRKRSFLSICGIRQLDIIRAGGAIIGRSSFGRLEVVIPL